MENIEVKAKYLGLENGRKISETFFEIEAVCCENSTIEKETQRVNELLDIFIVKKDDLQSGSYKKMPIGDC